MLFAVEERNSIQRLRLKIGGAVQGVGFRPFVYACAKRCDLRGFVRNETGGVTVEIEGTKANLARFQKLLRKNEPPLAQIISIEIEEIALSDETDFRIIESANIKSENTIVSPDVCICADCLRELFDDKDRRFRYPFINCTNCGPRFTITKDIPYDRPNTTMRFFVMCKRCQREYDDPLNRRFHAQPNACPKCGPRVWFQVRTAVVSGREEIVENEDAICTAQKNLRRGKIIAVKGIGGFHLACDARSDAALKILRERKGRVDKPFAVMCKELKTAKNLVEINQTEAEILTSKERPIVLLKKKTGAEISVFVAPGNQFLGVMLPYSPLHYLLFDEGLDVLVMTSGNFSNEPIVTENREALEKLDDLADAFLLHDREIHVPCDDSVVRICDAETRRHEDTATKVSPFTFYLLPYRRSRGYAPFPVALPFRLPPVLAVGGELKAAFCLAKDEFAFMSQHIGDMENLETLLAFEKSFGQMKNLFRIEPEIFACDRHPNYLSSNWARRNAEKFGVEIVEVQHHHAHIAAVMAENGVSKDEKVIGFAFDGTGYGTDGAIWGGEVLIADYRGFERAAHLKYVPLAGGDAAIKKPYRAALAHLREAGVKWNENLPSVAACAEIERRILLKQFEKNFNTIPTSSFGRLYDSVASIAGIRQTITYEAQAAIEFEAVLDENISDSYKFELIEGETIEIDCARLVRQTALDVLDGVSAGEVSAKFNNAAANLILKLAILFRNREKLNKVALSGGCFQNVALLKASLKLLRENDFEVLTHRKVPPNDGGLALGQAVIASQQLQVKSKK